MSSLGKLSSWGEEEVIERSGDVLQAILIYDEKCDSCKEDELINAIEEKLGEIISFKKVDYSSQAGREQIEK